MTKILKKLDKVKDFDSLKAIGTKIYNSKKKNKDDVIQAYCLKRKELDQKLVETADSKFRNLLYQVNTMGSSKAQIAKVGMLIYELTPSLTSHQSDLLFRAYRHQKKKYYDSLNSVSGAGE